MFKLGGYKTFDLNGVDWTLSGDVFASHNDMKRRFMVGTDVYENKADYTMDSQSRTKSARLTGWVKTVLPDLTEH